MGKHKIIPYLSKARLEEFTKGLSKGRVMGKHKGFERTVFRDSVRYTQDKQVISGITSTTSSDIVWSCVTDRQGVVASDRKGGPAKRR